MSSTRLHAEGPEVYRTPVTLDSLACLSLLFGVCLLSVLCFDFVSDSNKLNSGLKRSYGENTFRIDFQPV